MYLDLDLTDIIIAEDRLANFNDMLDLTNCSWNEKRPAEDLQNIVSTVHHINALLIKELREITEEIDGRILDERQKLKMKHEWDESCRTDIEKQLKFLEDILDFEENSEFLKAKGNGFAEGNTDEGMRLLCALITGFGTGCAYEKAVAGKGEDAKTFLAEYRAKYREWMVAEQDGAVAAAGSAVGKATARTPADVAAGTGLAAADTTAEDRRAATDTVADLPNDMDASRSDAV